MKQESSPFELYTAGNGGFIAFERNGETMALPLYSLKKILLRGESSSQQLVCDFQSVLLTISGQGLSEIMDSLMLGRVRLIRVGQSTNCTIESLSIAIIE